MSYPYITALYRPCRGWVQEEELVIPELSAICRANITTLKSQLPGHVPEALQKLEEFFIEPLIVLDGMLYQGFHFTPSLHDEPNDLITIRYMLTGIMELTEKDDGVSAMEFLNTEALDKLDWLRDSLLRFLNRRAGHSDYNHRLPEPDSQFLRSKYKSLRKHVEHQILQDKGSENIESHGLNALQRRLVDSVLLRKDRFERARAHYKTVMGTSTLEGKSQGQSRFKSPIQPEPILNKHDFPERPCFTRSDPYRTCPCCFRSILEKDVQSEWGWKCHVYDDLASYTCIAEDCPEGGHLFSTIQSLQAHMETSHNKLKYSCCDASFSDYSELLLHLDGSSSASYVSRRRMVLGLRSCPLCSFTADEDSVELANHVIDHMFRFSSKFWPWIETYDEADEPPEYSRVDSKAGHWP
ncbi:unnamed protein product [Clonostachys byssicola]|uniref:C2H2-type domain-containing protein n=1 Tax=Clonostachys byssicola TaxID=160290 RepID=A0A9N9UU80_9HYPO|nr:unnamed protein product [Clonostachys byssicola]